MEDKIYDVLVVGGGHSGIEASLAASRMGCKTILITFSKDKIGEMSCNPAIGGVGKGQLVKEIDALGGEIAKAADACGIQFRQLNTSRGPAVRSSRAQEDREMYRKYMIKAVETQRNLEIKEGEVIDLLLKGDSVEGVKLSNQEKIFSRTVVLACGTFLNGLIYIGLNHFSGGRIGEKASVSLSDCLKNIGFKILRFNTDTCPRLDGKTINFGKTKIQEGDKIPVPFSFSTKKLNSLQVPCYITYTNQKVHEIIKKNLDRSPFYAGIIKGPLVRYCPSIEDKIVKFADKQKHQIFLEPEGLNTDQYYPNGLFTALPEDVQSDFLHSIEGLENVGINRFSYGIEYDVIEPTQLFPTLETKIIKNLFLAGQINGTTGYEEAAAQGLIAGINACLKVKDKPLLILSRFSSYIGVLIDDLTTKGTLEPYRMFTSRVEYRLLLREDNADLRLRETGHQIGLVNKQDYLEFCEKKENIEKGTKYLKEHKISISGGKKISLYDYLRRPEVKLQELKKQGILNLDLSDSVMEEIEISAKYHYYIQREIKEIEKFKNLEKIKIPTNIDYSKIAGLSKEIQEKLKKFKPLSLGQASRISGVTPAAISILMIYLARRQGSRRF